MRSHDQGHQFAVEVTPNGPGAVLPRLSQVQNKDQLRTINRRTALSPRADLLATFRGCLPKQGSTIGFCYRE